MTEFLYLQDHYLKEFDAKILEIPDSRSVVLDRTAIYPKGGGQPSDQGIISIKDGTRYTIKDSSKQGEKIVHVILESFPTNIAGEQVHCSVNWPLRYSHMRYHTALHILSGVVFLKFGARITGGQIYADRARLDFSLDDLSRERIATIESEANKIVNEDLEVKTYWLSTEEALRRKDMYKLSADLLPKGLDKLRIVDIVGFDAQLDGGTHVAKTSEVGKIKISKTQNKGKDNKRIEIILD